MIVAWIGFARVEKTDGSQTRTLNFLTDGAHQTFEQIDSEAQHLLAIAGILENAFNLQMGMKSKHQRSAVGVCK
ncbi:hypothetical protein D3C86_2019900 [compost metagenome]